MQLPGGLTLGNERLRSFQFKPITGELEMYFNEAFKTESSLPALVTGVLIRSLRHVGQQEVTENLVRSLSVGDRQYLLCELAGSIHQADNWLSVNCCECDELMDVSFRYQQLPVKAPNENFPNFEFQTEKEDIGIRVPNGADQEDLAMTVGSKDDWKDLLQKLITSDNDITVEDLTDEELARIEKEVEDASPEVGTQLQAFCPHCNAENRIDIDLYGFLRSNNTDLFVDIHQLATHYHWSESEILKLERDRRKMYLSIIDKARGVSGQD